MKPPNADIIENLQTGAQMLSHLAGQYRVDVTQLKVMGLKWLASRVKDWQKATEFQICKFHKRLLYFETDPAYDIGAVEGIESVDGLLEQAGGLVQAILDQFYDYRKAAWDARADYTPDVYEHAIQELEHQAMKIERERSLIVETAKPKEGPYIGARLEDD